MQRLGVLAVAQHQWDHGEGAVALYRPARCCCLHPQTADPLLPPLLLLLRVPHVPLLQVAEWIGQRLAAPYRYKYSMTDNDLPLPRNQQPVQLPDRWGWDRGTQACFSSDGSSVGKGERGRRGYRGCVTGGWPPSVVAA